MKLALALVCAANAAVAAPLSKTEAAAVAAANKWWAAMVSDAPIALDKGAPIAWVTHFGDHPIAECDDGRATTPKKLELLRTCLRQVASEFAPFHKYARVTTRAHAFKVLISDQLTTIKAAVGSALVVTQAAKDQDGVQLDVFVAVGPDGVVRAFWGQTYEAEEK